MTSASGLESICVILIWLNSLVNILLYITSVRSFWQKFSLNFFWIAEVVTCILTEKLYQWTILVWAAILMSLKSSSILTELKFIPIVSCTTTNVKWAQYYTYDAYTMQICIVHLSLFQQTRFSYIRTHMLITYNYNFSLLSHRMKITNI